MASDDRVAHDVAEAHEEYGEQEQDDRDTAVAGQGHREGEDCRAHGHALGEEEVPGQDVESVPLLPPPVADLLDQGEGQKSQPQEKGEVVIVGLRTDLREVAGGYLLEAFGERAERAAAEEDLGAAAEEQHPGQRDDERRNADVRDPEALPRSGDRSDDEGEDQGEDPWHILLDHHHGAGGGDEGGQ